METKVFEFCRQFHYTSIKIARHGDLDCFYVTLTFNNLGDNALKLLLLKYISFVSVSQIKVSNYANHETEILLTFDFELPF